MYINTYVYACIYIFTLDIQDISLDDLQDILPAHQPRFVAYSYCLQHDDGRISYPLCFIFISPTGCKPEMQMMYAGTKLSLVNAGGFTKVSLMYMILLYYSYRLSSTMMLLCGVYINSIWLCGYAYIPVCVRGQYLLL